MSDNKLSLSQRMKAERQEQKAPSLAERMKAKRAEADEKAPSLSERMKAQRNQEKATSLSQRMKERVEATKQTSESPADVARRLQDAIGAKLAELDDAEIDDAMAEELKVTIDEQRNKFEELIGRVKLTDIVRDVTQTGNKIEGLPEAIGKLRARGYIYRSYLEDKVEVLATQWDGVQDKIDHWIEQEADALSDELDNAEKLFVRIDSDPDITIADKKDSLRVGSLMDILESKVEAAEEQVNAIFEDLKRETNNTLRQVDDVEKILDWGDDASFDFNAGENLFLVAKAEWDDGGEKPDGLFYLTDQRFVFEQNEKTGKRLGMFGGKQVQEVLWEAPVNVLEEVQSENKGMMGGKDMLHLTFGSGAPYGHITVELKGGVDNAYWETQIKRMMRGELESESISPPDDDFVERLREAPTACPTCGANLPQITGTPSQIDCDYCGTSIRI